MSFNKRDWDVHPALNDPGYKSTQLRGPKRALVPIAQSLSEMTGLVYGHNSLGALDHDLTKNAVKDAEPQGERIIVTGKVMDESGRPVPHTLVEVWQTNAAGRYIHLVDQHDAPLDPNFLGAGRCITDEKGVYKFLTIKPGAYPWGNHPNAWRPNHIHFSLFGPSIATRLITQMYFPGDPLLQYDPIFLSSPNEAARNSMVAQFSLDVTEPGYALGYIFNIVLRGRSANPMES